MTSFPITISTIIIITIIYNLCDDVVSFPPNWICLKLKPKRFLPHIHRPNQTCGKLTGSTKSQLDLVSPKDYQGAHAHRYISLPASTWHWPSKLSKEKNQRFIYLFIYL